MCSHDMNSTTTNDKEHTPPPQLPTLPQHPSRPSYSNRHQSSPASIPISRHTRDSSLHDDGMPIAIADPQTPTNAVNNHTGNPHDNHPQHEQFSIETTQPYPLRMESYRDSTTSEPLLLLDHDDMSIILLPNGYHDGSGSVGLKYRPTRPVMDVNASGTNLNVFLRGDRRHSLSPPMNDLLAGGGSGSGSGGSSGGVKKLTKGFGSSASLARYAAGAATTTGTGGSSSGGVGGDKKRLVDQFYNSSLRKVGGGAGGSSAELSSLFRNGGVDTLGLNGESKLRYINGDVNESLQESEFEMNGNESTRFDEVMDRGRELDDEIFMNILNEGGFKFNYDASRLFEDEELMNYLLNIDSMIDVDPEDSSKPFDQLGNVMANIGEKFNDKSISPSEHGKIGHSLDELNSLERYLSNLHAQTQQLMNHLVANRVVIQQKYQNEINENINRITQISNQLQGLEDKLNQIRDRITKHKLGISNEMMQRLNLLERVNRQMQAYSQESSSRKFMQVNIAIAVILLMIAVYYGYTRGYE